MNDDTPVIFRRIDGVQWAGSLTQERIVDDALISTERLLGILRAGGLSDQVCAYAVDLIPLYVCSVAYEESVALPADRFPNIVALAGALTAGTGDDRFEFGVQVIVAGIAAFTSSRG